ncbi:hypothetical protein ACFYWN_43610, partial [Streptomyces sp. NPDC002917]|uniref:hypothetical protein n=1 Tax=Streptomyces sp. NPDC002917 TaxID=3364671 RepID=UPI003692E6F1
RVDGDDGDAVFGGHGDDAGLELAGGHTGDELPKPNAVAFAVGVGWLAVGPGGGVGGCECV